MRFYCARWLRVDVPEFAALVQRVSDLSLPIFALTFLTEKTKQK